MMAASQQTAIDWGPDHPVLLVGARSAFAAWGIEAWLEVHSWPTAWAENAERAKWLASIQRTSAVVVAGDIQAMWGLVQAVRAVTDGPLVVLADPPTGTVVDLVAAGVDAVVNPDAGAEDVFARIIALYCAVDTAATMQARCELPERIQQCHDRQAVRAQ